MAEANSHHVSLSVQKCLSKLGASLDANIMVGVSGGMDSMVLLHILWDLGYKVAAAHVNFNLRGVDSDADALLVQDWCKGHDIPHFELSQDTTTYASEYKQSIQLAAREIRYNWWEHLLAQHSFDLIATAHHFDDNIETILMNLLRGTGLKGLTGIPQKRDHYIRPLLEVTRKEIESYAQTFDIPYRTDRSNESDHYQRNKIRHHLMPLLNEWYPGLHSSMKHSLHRIHMEWDTWKAAYDHWIHQSVTADRNGFLINVKSEKLAFLLRWLEVKGIPWNLAHDYLTAPGTSSGLPLAYNNLTFSRTENGFYLETEILPIKILMHKPSYFVSDDFDLHIERVSIDQFKPGEDPFTEYMNEEVMQWPLELRTVEPGDRFQPIGMQGKTKKLQDLMVDQKIEIYQKARQLVLTNQEHILWVVGLRLDERAKVDMKNKHIYKVSYRLPGNAKS